MSYAAEPYGQFVDDLLTGLTGGVVRERFVFLKENEPFELSPPGPVLPDSLRVHGQAQGAFRRFQAGRDFTFEGRRVVWRADAQGLPPADAVWPDEGTTWFANYEHGGPTGTAPLLNDRNPGSVVRLLAESFAREYAVFSQQLEAIYRGAYLDTATGRDLDQLVRLVGLTRDRTTQAGGLVTFSRSTPAPADIFVPAGTRISTAAPPVAAFETAAPVTLRRGNLSVDALVRALASGAGGVVPARAISVLHKPILGIDQVSNAQPTRFGTTDETDDALRARARRALDGAGRATVGALVGALTSLPDVREKDIRISEDHLQHPGVVRLDVVVPNLDLAQQARAVELIESHRPAGIRVVHKLRGAEIVSSPPASPPRHDADPLLGDVPVVAAEGLGDFYPVAVQASVFPATLDLTAAERSALADRARAVVRAFVDDAGVGSALVYNALVARLMALEGVLDVDLALWSPTLPAPQVRRRNVMPRAPGQRPTLAEGDLDIRVGGTPLALDVQVRIRLVGAGTVGDAQSNRDAARLMIADRLAQALDAWPADRALELASLRNAVPNGDTYQVEVLGYKVDYIEAGVRILKKNTTIRLSGLERLWLRTLEAVPE